jgi:hypothetical protein
MPVMVMASGLAGYAEARADINFVHGCSSIPESISIQFTIYRKAANDLLIAS